MRVKAGSMAGLLLISAWAAGAGKNDVVGFDPQMEVRLMELEARARQLYPRRRDTPLRYLNMTDDEVREVHAIATKYKMPQLVNISPVVTGCPCEEGGSCTDQVFITSLVNERPISLQLSRRKNLWTVGVIQKWWLEYAALKAREPAMSRAEYHQARMQLLLSLPACADPAKAKSPGPQVAETRPTK
ncbi:MAG TPA: hypothetical protein VM146_18820 [Steroidobacteraceae bacterium]|nr:hypothetical protein [Steroidobacteraceae bacterium]